MNDEVRFRSRKGQQVRQPTTQYQLVTFVILEDISFPFVSLSTMVVGRGFTLAVPVTVILRLNLVGKENNCQLCGG